MIYNCLFITALLSVGVCAMTDLKDQKIYNKVLILFFICAIIMRNFSLNHAFIFKGFFDSAIVLGIGFILFHFQVMGAGDVKLMSLIAFCVGILDFIYALFISSLFAFFYAAWLIIIQQRKGRFPFACFMFLGLLIFGILTI